MLLRFTKIIARECTSSKVNFIKRKTSTKLSPLSSLPLLPLLPENINLHKLRYGYSFIRTFVRLPSSSIQIISETKLICHRLQYIRLRLFQMLVFFFCSTCIFTPTNNWIFTCFIRNEIKNIKYKTIKPNNNSNNNNSVDKTTSKKKTEKNWIVLFIINLVAVHHSTT